MNKIYIAGPMTGIPKFNFPSFDAQARLYRRLGYVVFNPADHDRQLLGKPEDWEPKEEDSIGSWKAWNPERFGYCPTLREMLGNDLAWIAQEATHINMIKGWENSRGARAEHALAVALDLVILYD